MPFIIQIVVAIVAASSPTPARPCPRSHCIRVYARASLVQEYYSNRFDLYTNNHLSYLQFIGMLVLHLLLIFTMFSIQAIYLPTMPSGHLLCFRITLCILIRCHLLDRCLQCSLREERQV